MPTSDRAWRMRQHVDRKIVAEQQTRATKAWSKIRAAQGSAGAAMWPNLPSAQDLSEREVERSRRGR